MGEEWYKDLPDDYFKSDLDEAYERAFNEIRQGLAAGLGFDDACARIDINDEKLLAQIIKDMIKVLIAEEHFAKKVPIDELARQLKVSKDHLEVTKAEMLEEVQESPLKNYYKDPNSNNFKDN